MDSRAISRRRDFEDDALYKSMNLVHAYSSDLLIDNAVVVELKAVEKIEVVTGPAGLVSP